MPLLIVVLAAFVAGSAVALTVLRWPHVSLDAPHLDVAARPASSRFRRVLRARMDPATETGLLLTVAVGVVIVGAVAVGVLLAMIRARRGLASYDVRVSTFAAAHASAGSTAILKRINTLGGTGCAVVGSVIVGCLETIRRRSRHVIEFLVLVVGGQFALANVIKLLIDRTRPSIDQLSGFSSSSFPSGHATAAAAGFAAFALLLGSGRSKSVRAILSAAAVAIAVAVALTRVFLGVHWLTDVIGGLFVGWSWFALCSIAFGGRWLRFGAPLERTIRPASMPPVTAA